jgi:hypothetical protein
MTGPFTLRVHTDADGSLWGEVRELPGCFASVDTEAELLEAAREAIAMDLHGSAGAVPASDDVVVRAVPGGE